MKRILFLFIFMLIGLSGCASTNVARVATAVVEALKTTPTPTSVPILSPTNTPMPTPALLYLPHLKTQCVKFGMTSGDIKEIEEKENNEINTESKGGILMYDIFIEGRKAFVMYIFEDDYLNTIFYSFRNNDHLLDVNYNTAAYYDIQKIYINKYGEPDSMEHDDNCNYKSEWDRKTFKLKVNLLRATKADVESGIFNDGQLTLGVLYTSDSISNNENKPKQSKDENQTYPLEFSKIIIDNINSGSSTWFRGSVKNISNKTIYFVSIKLSCKDYGGNVIDTTSTYAVGAEGLAPGESTKYEAYVDKDLLIQSVTASILSYE